MSCSVLAILSFLGFSVVVSNAARTRRLRGDVEKANGAVLHRMEYWTPAEKIQPPTDSYMLFDGDAGGPNNIRIGWEMTGLMALETGRTLVLPPPSSMYLLDWGPGRQRLPDEMATKSTTTKVEDLINLEQLRGYLPTITADEFEGKTGMKWQTAVAMADQAPAHCKVESYKRSSNRFLYMSGEKRAGFSCGEWAVLGGPGEELRGDMQTRDWSLLTHGFVWHEDVFNIASHAVNFLGLFNYTAIHARYNDFQFHKDQQTADGIAAEWGDVLKLSPKMYIASDEPVKVKELTKLNGVEVYTFDDMLNGPLKQIKDQYSEERWFKLTGPVEELICTYAKLFVATKSSTFSGHINRMRIHVQAPVTQTLFLTSHPSAELREDLQQDFASWKSQDDIHRNSPMTGDVFFQQNVSETQSEKAS